MDLQAAFEWYSGLARRPGWADYVRDRVHELAAEHPEEFARLPRMLASALPWLSQATMARPMEPRANVYRLEPRRFAPPSAPVRKRKDRHASH